MLDVYKFLEEKKKPTLPPGMVDLSSAPRVTMPSVQTPPAPKISPVRAATPQADLMRGFRQAQAPMPQVTTPQMTRRCRLHRK